MRTLELSEEKGQKLDELEAKAIAVVDELLDSDKEATDAQRAAVKVLGIVAKNRMTLSAREALHFNMAASLGDPEQLKKYVQTTCPQLTKQLEAVNA